MKHDNWDPSKVSSASMRYSLNDLEGEVRFQQALHCAEVEFAAKSVTWRDLTLLAEHGEAFNLRINQITTRKGVRVDLHTKLNAHLARLPFLKRLPKIRFGDTWFELARCGQFLCAIAGTRSSYCAIGKQFTLDVALLLEEKDGLTVVWRENLFRVVGSSWEKPSWFYHDHEDLACCIEEVEGFLNRVGAGLKTSFETQFNSVDPLIPELGDLSANEALRHAVDFLSVDAGELTLDGFSAWPRRLGYPAPDTTQMGRLLPNGMWRVFVREPSAKREGIVDVPFKGPTRGGWQSARHSSPGISQWFDSTDAAKIFAEQVGTKTFTTNTLQLQGYDPIARWTALVQARPRSIHCATGRNVE
jgi:hypothetical protein